MKTAFGRTFYSAALILLLTLLLVGASFQVLARAYMKESVVDDLQQNSSTIADLAAAYASGEGFDSTSLLVNLDVASRVAGTDAVICDSDGYVVICSDVLSGCSHRGMRVDSEYFNKVVSSDGDVATGVIQGLYTESRYVVSTPITDTTTGENLGIVIVSKPVSDSNEILNRISNIFIFVSLLTALIAFAAMSLFARRQARPLKTMADTARAFGHGKLNARVRLDRNYSEEVEELALAFNNMAGELQKSEYQRQEFVANVSHELKTPMTTISGYIDGILDGTVPPENVRHYLQIVSDETKRLSRLVRSMLDISRLQDQGGVPEEKKSRFDMEECAGQVLITFEQKINNKKLNVEVDMPEHPVYTRANPDYITQVIYNLIDNAVKFCPDGGHLGLKVAEGGSKVYVSVSNDGDTIPPEELPLVFDRFHKLDKSRSQNRDGWGLGLYIVKTIVCSHGENISVTSRDGKTEFTFTMPLVS